MSKHLMHKFRMNSESQNQFYEKEVADLINTQLSEKN
jgi:hypothetical protein